MVSLQPNPQSSVTSMPEIQFSVSGIIKLLWNFKLGKATGPGKHRPLVLKKLREEIDPIIQLILDRSVSACTNCQNGPGSFRP